MNIADNSPTQAFQSTQAECAGATELHRPAVMRIEYIAEVGIDDAGCLYVTPAQEDFRYIYRAAMGVQWDDKLRVLYSPAPRELSYFQWYERIHAATKGEYGIDLRPCQTTHWKGVARELQSKMEDYRNA